MDNNVGAIADLAVKAQGRAEFLQGPEGRKFLIVPAGMTTKEVLDDPYGMIVPAPVRIKQAVLVQTADSLVEYANRFKNDNSVLFADMASNTLLVVIDYHAKDTADHLDHSARLVLQGAEEWKTWSAISGKMFEQGEFARFLEENAPDVKAPTGADLLEVCRDLQAVRRADFKRVVRTSGDDERFEYTEETEARTTKGDVDIPTKFLLDIPVYFDRRSIEIAAFLRWRLNDGALTLGIQLHRAEYVRQAEFKQIVVEIAEKTGLTAVFGKPSAS